MLSLYADILSPVIYEANQHFGRKSNSKLFQWRNYLYHGNYWTGTHLVCSFDWKYAEFSSVSWTKVLYLSLSDLLLNSCYLLKAACKGYILTTFLLFDLYYHFLSSRVFFYYLFEKEIIRIYSILLFQCLFTNM